MFLDFSSSFFYFHRLQSLNDPYSFFIFLHIVTVLPNTELVYTFTTTEMTLYFLSSSSELPSPFLYSVSRNYNTWSNNDTFTFTSIKWCPQLPRYIWNSSERPWIPCLYPGSQTVKLRGLTHKIRSCTPRFCRLMLW